MGDFEEKNQESENLITDVSSEETSNENYNNDIDVTDAETAVEQYDETGNDVNVNDDVISEDVQSDESELSQSAEPEDNIDDDIIKSGEQFGEIVCSRIIFISQRFYRFLKEKKLNRGLQYEPIQLA